MNIIKEQVEFKEKIWVSPTDIGEEIKIDRALIGKSLKRLGLHGSDDAQRAHSREVKRVKEETGEEFISYVYDKDIVLDKVKDYIAENHSYIARFPLPKDIDPLIKSALKKGRWLTCDEIGKMIGRNFFAVGMTLKGIRLHGVFDCHRKHSRAEIAISPKDGKEYTKYYYDPEVVLPPLIEAMREKEQKGHKPPPKTKPAAAKKPKTKSKAKQSKPKSTPRQDAIDLAAEVTRREEAKIFRLAADTGGQHAFGWTADRSMQAAARAIKDGLLIKVERPKIRGFWLATCGGSISVNASATPTVAPDHRPKYPAGPSGPRPQRP